VTAATAAAAETKYKQRTGESARRVPGSAMRVPGSARRVPGSAGKLPVGDGEKYFKDKIFKFFLCEAIECTALRN